MLLYIDEQRSPLSTSLGRVRCFSNDVGHFPEIKDPQLLYAFKDLMAASWDELPNTLVTRVKAALSKNTDDQAGKEHLTNVLRAAEAVEEFGGMVMQLKMDMDDSVGISGEVMESVLVWGICCLVYRFELFVLKCLCRM